MKQYLAVLIITVTFIAVIISNANAWHENLGIDANKAAELYQAKPNDPAIVQWKIALQSAINSMDKCFNPVPEAGCAELMSTIISNCSSHPNELLACNDSRIAHIPAILNYTIEAKKQLDEARSKFFECIRNGGSSLTCA